MLAKKCDRCGKLYETYSTNVNEDSPNSFGLIMRSVDNANYKVKKVMDLCPNCMTLLNDWIDPKRFKKD